MTCPCVTCVGGHACELWWACVDSHCTVFQLLPLGCCALLRAETITTAKFPHEFGLVKMSQMDQHFLVSGLETYQMVDIWRVLDEVISAITSSMTKLDLLTVQRRDKGFRRQLFTTLICSTCITQHSSTSFLWIHIEIESAGIPSSQLWSSTCFLATTDDTRAVLPVIMQVLMDALDRKRRWCAKVWQQHLTAPLFLKIESMESMPLPVTILKIWSKSE